MIPSTIAVVSSPRLPWVSLANWSHHSTIRSVSSSDAGRAHPLSVSPTVRGATDVQR